MQYRAKPVAPGSVPIYRDVAFDVIVVSETTYPELIAWGLSVDDPMMCPANGQIVLRAVDTLGVDAILSPETFEAMFEAIPGS